MKILIKENQLEALKKLESMKKMFFKYWDKNGGVLDQTMFKLFGFDKITYQIGDKYWLSKDEVRKWLIEWRGEEKSRQLLDKILNSNPYKVDNCGGYEFEFDVFHYEVDSSYNVTIDVKIDDKRGRVMLMMLDGRMERLSDAIRNDEYGWEVENEIIDCIWVYFKDKVYTNLGYNIDVESWEFTSKTNPER